MDGSEVPPPVLGARSRDGHVPVLLEEVVSTLAPGIGGAGEVVVDGTAGLGGHSAALAARMDEGVGGGGGTVVLMDLDPANLARAAQRVRERAPGVQVVAHHASFVEAPRLLAAAGLRADVVLADLGFSSNQMFDPSRGFSFSGDGPLDMRLNPLAAFTAGELVNSLTERELADLIRENGEEPPARARAMARNVVRGRADGPISSTARLAELIRAAVPTRERFSGGIDPATRAFQALRIAVNDELGSLGALLGAVEMGARRIARGEPAWLRPGARVGIIGFHSLEDRPVKQSFASLAEKNLAVLLTRKAIQASDAEVAANPRSRSAKFRAVRIGAAVATVD